jgi:hypothetical protein
MPSLCKLLPAPQLSSYILLSNHIHDDLSLGLGRGYRHWKRLARWQRTRSSGNHFFPSVRTGKAADREELDWPWEFTEKLSAERAIYQRLLNSTTRSALFHEKEKVS